MLVVLVNPPVVNQPDRNRIEEVQFLPSGAARHDETSVFKDPEVFHHTEAAHAQLCLEFGQAQTIVREQAIEKVAPRSVRQGLEDSIIIIHPT